MKSEATTCAIHLLTRREHGAFELVRKLEHKGYPAHDAKEALEICQRLGYQSDARFALQMCRTRIRQGYGPLRIRGELSHLKVDALLIDEVVQDEAEQWVLHAKAVWVKKYKKLGDVPFKVLQKQKQFLFTRGFSADIITQLLKQEI